MKARVKAKEMPFAAPNLVLGHLQLPVGYNVVLLIWECGLGDFLCSSVAILEQL